MAKYETMLITSAALDEEASANLVGKFKSLIEANGTIDSVDEWGKRRLAYPINDENEDDVNDDAQLVILSVGEDDEGEYLDVVEDDETLLEVSKLFEKRLSDQFEIE